MKKRTGWRRTLAGILAVLAVAAYAPAIAAGFTSGRTAIVAYAEGGVAYRTWDDEAKKLVDAETSTDYTEVIAGMTEWGKANKTTWYVVSEDTTIEDRIYVTGDVHLILCDGATLTAKHGIRVVEGNSLTIYGQQEGSGLLIANTESKTYKEYPSIMSYSEEIDDFNAGIGGDENETCGTVTINGGDISAYAGIDGSGIGGGNKGDGGIVNADGGEFDLGIGGDGDNGDLFLGKGMKLYGGNDADPTTEVPLVNGDYARSRYMRVSTLPGLLGDTVIEFDENGEYYFTPKAMDYMLSLNEDTVYVVKKDFSQAVVTVDVVNQSASVQIDNKDVPTDEYTLTFGKDAETASEKFPSDPGEYYAFATAKDTSKTYVGMAHSASFSIADPDQLAAQQVIEKINAISDAEGIEAIGAAIQKARTAYDALTEKQKGYVTNVNALTTAETLYAEALKEKTDLPKAVVTLNSDGTVSVKLGGNEVDSDEYTLSYGQTQASATELPPTEHGNSYYVFAAAKADSKTYIGTA